MKLIKLQCAYRLRVSQYELQFTLLVPLIAVKFSARIVVIHLTALLEYYMIALLEYLIWITRPRTIITERKNRLATKSSAQIKLPGIY